MTREHRYADAVRLLGGQDPTVKTLDSIAGAATLGMLPIVELIEAKNELFRVGNAALDRWRSQKTDKNWRSRTERIEAAHTIVVVAAFFVSIDSLDLPFKFRDLELRRIEQDAILVELCSPVHPTPQVPFELVKKSLSKYYRELGDKFNNFISGLSMWEGLNNHQQRKISREFSISLPQMAVRQYEDYYRQLMIDVPEFSYWANIVDHEATRAGLASLKTLLLSTTGSETLPEQLKSLTSTQESILRQPIAETGDVPAGMQLPTLGEAYITPRFRVGQTSHSMNPSIESCWEDKETREDLPSFIAGYLNTSEAADRPLVVLGQPGAGKSVLTKVLSAHLPKNFLPVRVPLREVSANEDIQTQIEQAVYRSTGERIQWTSLARTTTGTLPVILLDGFDELLQATGVRQSDYIERVIRFQQREKDAGRAVAVIVTSRTAVADRARMPKETAVIRLEPFNKEQIHRWIDIWNRSNASYFSDSNIHPFTANIVKAQPHLSEQPLLLLMMALYDTQENALDKALAELNQAELYERLMKSFATRELEKKYSRDKVPSLVEQELLTLSIVAFSMFNRGRQWASAEEVTIDLDALFPRQQSAPESFDTPLTSGERAFGRFFFVHSSQAIRDKEILQTYEFLHATFGEYLIARLIASLMHNMTVQRTGLFATEIDDKWLCTLLSWATISSRMPIVNFLQEIFQKLDQDDRQKQRQLLLQLISGFENYQDTSYSSYKPQKTISPKRFAFYSGNVITVALSYTGELFVREIFSASDDYLGQWQSFTLLWRSQYASEQWTSMVNAIATNAVPQGDEQDIKLSLSHDEWLPETVEIYLDDNLDTSNLISLGMGADWSNRIRRQAAFSCLLDESIVIHALEPFLTQRSRLVDILERKTLAGKLQSSIHRLLLIMAQSDYSTDQRSQIYADLISVDSYKENEDIIYNTLRGDLASMEPVDAAKVLETSAKNSIGHDWKIFTSLAEELGIYGQVNWPNGEVDAGRE